MANDKELKISITSDFKAQGFNDANKNLNGLTSNTDKLSSNFGSLVRIVASLGALNLFKEKISQTLDFADSLNKLSQKTGISADGLYSLSAAAKLSDVNFEDMSKSLGKFSKSIGENSKTFDTLGISIKNNDGTLKNSFDILGELSDKFADMPDGASKATLAMQLFGKSGTDIIPLLNSGSDSLRKFLGVMDQDTAQAAEAFNDSITNIGLAMDAVYMKTVKELAPTLSVLSDHFLGLADDSDELGDSLSGKLANAMKGVVKWGYGITAVFDLTSDALSNFGKSFGAMLGGDEEGTQKYFEKIGTDVGKGVDKWGKAINDLDKAEEKYSQNKTERAKRTKSNPDYGLPDSEAIKKAQEEYKKAFEGITDSINKNGLNAYDYGVTLINKKTEEYKKAGIAQNLIDQYSFDAKMELGIKQLEQETKDREAREKEVKAQYDKEQDAMLGYYKAVGMESDAFYLEEVMKLQKLADAGILSNSQMLAVWTKDNEKFQDEQFKKSHEWLYDFFDNMDKALDNKLLDGFKTRFKNFGSWLKDLFSSIGDSIFASLSRTLAGSITSSLQGGIVNTFKSYGGFGSASLVGTSLSASDISSIAGLSGSTVTDGMIKTSGGTLIDQASGTVTAQGSDAMSILSTASSVKSAYGLLTNGVSGAILDGFTGLAGLTGIGALTEFGVGFASPFTAGLASTSPLAGVYGSGIAAAPSALTSAGAMAGGALLGGAVGYGVGSLGDMLFGAQTKAGIGGAIGGATGGLLASLGVVGGLPGIIGGALLGSILGGFFGSTKKTGAGIDILGNASADSANGQYWQSYKKKSWFSSSSWTNTTGFGEAENQAIMQTIGIYDTLLSQLGEYNDLIVVGGRFSNLQEFLDGNVVKSFLTAINPQNLDEIYKSWTDYAAKIDTTITQALATAVSGYTTYGRGFTEWKLGSGTTEQLKFTAEYLQKDFTALASSLGANGVTVDNFLAKYDEAIKANFTQDTITAWASLGDTLMKSTDATVKYKEALDQLNGTTTYSLPVDTMLAKVNNSSSTIDIKQLVTTQTNQNDSVIGLLVQSVKALQEILRVSQFGKTIV